MGNRENKMWAHYLNHHCEDLDVLLSSLIHLLLLMLPECLITHTPLSSFFWFIQHKESISHIIKIFLKTCVFHVSHVTHTLTIQRRQDIKKQDALWGPHTCAHYSPVGDPGPEMLPASSWGIHSPEVGRNLGCLQSQAWVPFISCTTLSATVTKIYWAQSSHQCRGPP